jgi:hypothetical protein
MALFSVGRNFHLKKPLFSSNLNFLENSLVTIYQTQLIKATSKATRVKEESYGLKFHKKKQFLRKKNLRLRSNQPHSLRV